MDAECIDPKNIPNRQLNMTHVKQIAVQLLRALGHLHQSGVIHRDVKLENILVQSCSEENISIKLTDFGLASAFEPFQKIQGNVGSSHYKAPEILN